MTDLVSRRAFIHLSVSTALIAAADGCWHVSFAAPGEEDSKPSSSQSHADKQPSTKSEGTSKAQSKADGFEPSVPEYGRKEEETKDRKLARDATGYAQDSSSKEKASGEEDGEKSKFKIEEWLIIPTGFDKPLRTPKTVWEAYEHSSEFTEKFVTGAEIFGIAMDPSPANISEKLPKVMGSLVSFATAGTMVLVGEAIGVALVPGGAIVWAAAAAYTAYLASKATEEHYQGQMPELAEPLSKVLVQHEAIAIQKLNSEIQRSDFLNQTLKTSLDRSFHKLGQYP